MSLALVAKNGRNRLRVAPKYDSKGKTLHNAFLEMN